MKKQTLRVHLMSLNVAGLNSLLNRRHLGQLIAKEKCDIVCCQETHLRKTEERYLREVFSGAIFHAPASVQKRGVFIGISKKLKWQECAVISDSEGQFLIIQGSVLGMDISRFICPANTEFLKDLIKKLEQYGESNLILMGE